MEYYQRNFYREALRKTAIAVFKHILVVQHLVCYPIPPKEAVNRRCIFIYLHG